MQSRLHIISVCIISQCFSIHTEFEYDEGNCHNDYLACESVCEFTCATGSSAKMVRELASHPTVMRAMPWQFSGAVKCVDRAEKYTVIDALRSVHGLRNISFQSSLILDKLEDYASIAHEDQQLLTWPCDDHCRYECMHRVSSERHEGGLGVLKFFGKWPFRRVFICQEILSSLYSILNGIPYFLFLISSVGRRAFLEHKVFGYGMTCAWIASAIFHCRDCTGTMYADYFSAVGGVTANLALAVIRSTGWNRYLVELFFGSLWAVHICYLVFVKFDFGWNMMVAIFLAASAAITWLVWYIRNRILIPHAWMIIVVTWGTSPLLLLFEVNDFPPGPLGLADAHSYWHLTTIPMSALCALFIYKDALFQLHHARGKIA